MIMMQYFCTTLYMYVTLLLYVCGLSFVLCCCVCMCVRVCVCVCVCLCVCVCVCVRARARTCSTYTHAAHQVWLEWRGRITSHLFRRVSDLVVCELCCTLSLSVLLEPSVHVCTCGHVDRRCFHI